VLPAVQAATLLIVGGEDHDVLPVNQQAFDLIRTSKKRSIIPGATHLFEEPGKLEEAAELASDWFLKYPGGET